MKCPAFTLAETLITLGIIGVVAALTITPLVQKYQEKTWLSQFKKVYNTISNAYARAYEEYGIANDWGIADENGEEKVFNILSQYLEVVPYTPPNKRKCADLDNNNGGSSEQHCYTSESDYQFALKDGALVAIKHDSDVKAPMLLVDTNGLKGPNTLGKDIFFLYLNARNNAPVVTGYPKWWTYDAVFCTKKRSPDAHWQAGGMCAAWIIGTGNMDYLHRELSLEEYKKVVFGLTIRAGKDQLE